MSITINKQITCIIVFFVVALVCLPEPAVQAQKMDQIRGKIAAIDIGRNTLTLKTEAFGKPARDVAIWVDQSTPLSSCGTGVYGNISKLKVGDKVIVSYYEVNNQFYAISISPSGFSLGDC